MNQAVVVEIGTLEASKGGSDETVMVTMHMQDSHGEGVFVSSISTPGHDFSFQSKDIEEAQEEVLALYKGTQGTARKARRPYLEDGDVFVVIANDETYYAGIDFERALRMAISMTSVEVFIEVWRDGAVFLVGGNGWIKSVSEGG